MIGSPTMTAALLTGGGVFAPVDTLLLQWDDDNGNPVFLQWDNDNGLPVYLAWGI